LGKEANALVTLGLHKVSLSGKKGKVMENNN